MIRKPVEDILTVSDLESLPEDGNRYEVIDGDLYVSTSPSYFHQVSLARLQYRMTHYLEENPIGEVVAGLGVMFDEFNGVIPDLVYFSNERKKSIGGLRLTGAPEIVVEVLSPGDKNEQRDRKVKRRLYSDHGVSEYWILDPDAKTVEVFRAVKTGGLRTRLTLRPGDILTTNLLPGFSCPIEDLFRARL
jgi:Uma2 family endonuclease